MKESCANFYTTRPSSQAGGPTGSRTRTRCVQSSSATAITIGPLKFILKHCLLHCKQTRQRYLCLLSSTNLPFGWWTLTDRRPTNSLMELLFPELKAHYRLMLDSKTLLRISASWTRTSDGLVAGRLTVCSLLPTRVLPRFEATNQKI